jgi:hypothetical protein
MLEKINGVIIALNTISIKGRQDQTTMVGVFQVLEQVLVELAEKEGAADVTENQ